MSHIKSFKFVYYTSMEDAKMQVAKLAYDFIKAEINENTVLGIGTGSTTNCFIEVLKQLKPIFETAVSSSKETSSILKDANIKVSDINEINKIDFYIDGADEVDKKLLKEMSESYDIVGQLIEKVELKAALQESMRYVSKVNGYLNETEPWKVIKEDEKRAARILYTALEAIDSCANLLYPFRPSTSDLVRSAIPRETENLWGLNKIKTGVELKEIGLLFNKFD